jgi:hypothetical protein
MNKWRLWLGAGMGEVISQELAATMEGLDAREMRRAKRLVRRGETAEDVTVARYAVAYAHDRQRRYERSSFMFGLCFGIGLGPLLIGIAVHLAGDDQALGAAATAALGVWCLIGSWRTWRAWRNVGRAEQVNLEYLSRSGAPYAPGGPPTVVQVPRLALAGSFALHTAVIVVTGGVLSVLLKDESFTLGRVLSLGVAGGLGGAVGVALGLSNARSR